MYECVTDGELDVADNVLKTSCWKSSLILFLLISSEKNCLPCISWYLMKKSRIFRSYSIGVKYFTNLPLSFFRLNQYYCSSRNIHARVNNADNIICILNYL